MSGRAGTAMLAGLATACGELAAEGTDPFLLAGVLAWSARPRRTPDALRRQCRDATGSGRLPAGMLATQLEGRLIPADAEAARPLVDVWTSLGVQVAVVGDPRYPGRLAEGWPQTDGPVFLAWRGTPLDDEVPAVALVGSRRASGYGRGVATWLAEAAARAGVRVVSGGAVGIDACAHEAALDTPGSTTVVLGCGHGVAYPRAHARPGGLFDRVLADGGSLVGELLPYEPARAGQVRARNRLVAGLADAVIVVEGGPRSGALLTAGAAAERGRAVLAVPGDVRAPGSAAPHRLLAEGAAPCTGPADLAAALMEGGVGRSAEVGEVAAGGPARAGHRPTNLPEPLHAELARAWPRPIPLDRLAAVSGRSVASVLAALTRARVAGEVAESVEGVRLRRRPS